MILICLLLLTISIISLNVFVNMIINFIINFNKLIEFFLCVVEYLIHKNTHKNVIFATTNNIFDSIQINIVSKFNNRIIIKLIFYYIYCEKFYHEKKITKWKIFIWKIKTIVKISTILIIFKNNLIFETTIM